MLTKAEAAAVFEALRSILGEKRARELIVEMLSQLSEAIGKVHDAPA